MSSGNSDLSMNSMVFVSSTCPGIPCASRPIYFPYALLHVALYLGLVMRWWHSINYPVSSLTTAARTSLGKLQLADSFAVMLFPWMLSIRSIVSWVIVCAHLLRVFIAGGDAGWSVGHSALLVDIVGTLGGASVFLTLGGGVSGCEATLGDEPFVLLWLSMFDRDKIRYSLFKSEMFVTPLASEFMLFWSPWARLCAAAVIMSPGVTVGVVMYLCLINIVKDILVVLVALFHTF